jgi:hypothetical protein
MTGAGVNSYNYVASLPKAALAFKSHWRVAMLGYRRPGEVWLPGSGVDKLAVIRE